MGNKAVGHKACPWTRKWRWGDPHWRRADVASFIFFGAFAVTALLDGILTGFPFRVTICESFDFTEGLRVIALHGLAKSQQPLAAPAMTFGGDLVLAAPRT